jgi:hypothetical protein
LSDADRRRAVEVGGISASPLPPSALVRAAGFESVESVNLTAAFLQTAAGYVEHGWRQAAGLRRALGDTAFEERQVRRSAMVGAIRDGLLQRALLVAARPGEPAMTNDATASG